ncbi:reverse gyrase, partial [Candidatus Bathyarchaeota archaeon]
MASKGMRSYILLPTSLLVRQVHDRICSMGEKAGLKVRIACYHSMMTKKKAEEALKAMREGDFDILITTSFFLARRRELLEDLRFDFIFVDDVDAFLRSSKNVDAVLKMLGVPDEIVGKALEALKLRTEVS